MRHAPLIPLLLILQGCPTMPSDALTSVANARAACARTSGMFGYVVVTAANSDKSSRTDDEVTVNPDTCAMTIKSTGTKPQPVAPVAVPGK